MSKTSESQAVKVVFEYLRKNERPFTASDIHNNLQTEFGFAKPLVQKALDILVKENKVREKVYGKSKIYFRDWSKDEVVSQETIQGYDKKIERLTQANQETLKEIKKVEAELSKFEKRKSLNQIEKEIKSTEEEVAEMEAKLEKLKESSKEIDPEEFKKVSAQRSMLVKEWRKRKALVNSALDMMMEGYPHSKKRLMQEIGIETDEDSGAVMPKDV